MSTPTTPTTPTSSSSLSTSVSSSSLSAHSLSDEDFKPRILDALPYELLDRLLDFCGHKGEIALSKCDGRAAIAHHHRDAIWIAKCRKRNIALPSLEILRFALLDEDLSMPFEKLLKYNTFGGRNLLELSEPTVSGMDVSTSPEEITTYSRSAHAWNDHSMGKVEYEIDLEELGFEDWILDGLRPKLDITMTMTRTATAHRGSVVSSVLTIAKKDHLGKTPLQNAISTLEMGQEATIVAAGLLPDSRHRGISCIAGAKKFRIVAKAGCNVVLSDIRATLTLPEHVPDQFQDWIEEGACLRDRDHIEPPHFDLLLC